MVNLSVDEKKIIKLMDQFYYLSGISIRFISYDRKVRIGGSVKANQRGFFCNVLRKDKLANKRCLHCDQAAFQTAISNQQLRIYTCHAGLTEVLVPVIFEDKALGYFMMGKLLRRPPTAKLWQEIKRKCKDYKIDHQALEQAFYKLIAIDDTKMHAAAYFVDMCSKYIYLSRIVSIREPLLINRVKQYVETNLEKDISITSLSNYLNVSKSHLSHIIKSEMGMSFTRYLHVQRVEKAKYMLRETDRIVKEIAADTGFNNQNYFNKIFKKLTMCTPKQYREREESHK
ncbi:MAG: PocR ligand-binding domain-containing protein [Firmicutes bacterium]|nr:PocR ligand-binding domain-containing protein [Bacillota bacterium]